MKHILPIFFLLCTAFLFSQDLKSPSEFLGYALGTQFTRHHEVVNYYNYLAKMAPEKMQLREYGQTNERRPLLLAYISTPKNMKKLETIRLEHLKSTTGESEASKAIVWLSYNVHGNESVSTEASMQTIYALLTSRQQFLENSIVIIDPCINPDGRDRYVNWYNQYKNTPFQVDPNSIEHHEGWWTGRSNHYMFDLNRDWAWLTQVESRQRIKMFNEWLPHVHADFHEQGVDQPYYFAPAAEPYHEVITDFQRNFQVTIGKNHAKYFNSNGWLYFTKETFDLFYPSYGDSYPTFNGAIGMTYEQGGSGRAGLGITTQIGDTLTLKDRIAHHHTTGISTVEVASEHAERLIREFKQFYRNRDYKYKSYLLSGNPEKLDALADLLDQHQIIYGAAANGSRKGYNYHMNSLGNKETNGKNMVVSTNQTKGTLVKVLFEPNAKLSDSLTYDITAWSLPYAYGLEALASETLVSGTDYNKEKPSNTALDNKAYAYLADWNSMQDARFLSELLHQNIRVRYTKEPFTLDEITYQSGSLIITKADNQNRKDFLRVLANTANSFNKKLTPTPTGFVEKGKDFGSSSFKMIVKPKVAILAGEPTSSLRVGEVWHFFEQDLNYPVTLIHSTYWQDVALTDYEVLILPGGDTYKTFMTASELEKLKKWVHNGGKLIAMEDALKVLGGKNGFDIKAREIKDSTAIRVRPHEDIAREKLKKEITGAIFKAKVDATHPLAFGYGDTYHTLKLKDCRYEYLKQGTAVYFEATPKPIAGFAGYDARKNMEKTMVFGVEAHGKGQVIYMVDNPLFRGFWENGKLFFANAMFMVD